jgi:hypothetical protein
LLGEAPVDLGGCSAHGRAPNMKLISVLWSNDSGYHVLKDQGFLSH